VFYEGNDRVYEVLCGLDDCMKELVLEISFNEVGRLILLGDKMHNKSNIEIVLCTQGLICASLTARGHFFIKQIKCFVIKAVLSVRPSVSYKNYKQF